MKTRISKYQPKITAAKKPPMWISEEGEKKSPGIGKKQGDAFKAALIVEIKTEKPRYPYTQSRNNNFISKLII